MGGVEIGGVVEREELAVVRFWGGRSGKWQAFREDPRDFLAGVRLLGWVCWIVLGLWCGMVILYTLKSLCGITERDNNLGGKWLACSICRQRGSLCVLECCSLMAVHTVWI